MKRKKKAVYRFMRWLEWHTGVKFPPTTIAWNHSVLLVNDRDLCFGVTHVYEPYHIGVAGKWGKKTVMSTLAHEFYHYLSAVKGWESYYSSDVETAADLFADDAVRVYYQNTKVKRRGDS